MIPPFSSFTAKCELGFLNTGKRFLRGYISKPTEAACVLLKNGTRDFQNSPSFNRSACFYATISGNFERFQYFNFETKFLGKRKPVSKNWSTVL